MTKAEFALIEAEIDPFQLGSRTRSVAQLAWFLDRVWRLEPEDVDDAICDGGGDKGIDALVVDDDLREITVFQSKHRDKPTSTQGDADLRQLVGSAVYFESGEAVDRLLESAPNAELQHLVSRLDIRRRVDDGAHATKLVFVTNGILDAAGADYYETVENRTPRLEIWDRGELAGVAQRTRRPELRPDTVTMPAVTAPMVLDLDGSTRMAIAVIPAAELVQLPGIDDLTIFSRNVRLSLRRTRINRELADTISRADEHAKFAAFHNGLTILTTRIDVAGNALTLTGVGVVNGCQSLVVLREQRAWITAGLSVVIRAIEVDPASDLADAITYRTNNQNPVDIRDQRSTDATQRDLQAQVRASYGADLGYSIRAGEAPGGREQLDNKLAAQLIMAVYVGEPWNAVRKVRLFDEDYHRIFSKEVTAHRLRFLHELSKAVDEARPQLRSDLAASFASVRFTIAYLVGKLLSETDDGRGILDRPQRWFPTKLGEVQTALQSIAADVVESVNFYVESEQAERTDRGEAFDAKVVFKSATGVRAVEYDVLQNAKRQARRDPTFLFHIAP